MLAWQKQFEVVIASASVHCEDVLLSLLTKSWLTEVRLDFEGRENAGEKKGGVKRRCHETQSKQDAQHIDEVNKPLMQHIY